MDYISWASEYWAAADKIGTVINSLTQEINLTKETGKRAELKMKKEQYIMIEIDMINTAKKLEERGSKNENIK